MGQKISPAQAAARSGLSRSTISRAIKKGELKALRNNLNHWRIEVDDFEVWSRDHAQITARDHPDAQAQVRLAELEAENRMLRDQVADLKEDRDAWRDLAQRPWWRRVIR